jgi:hypothetical protein
MRISRSIFGPETLASAISSTSGCCKKAQAETIGAVESQTWHYTGFYGSSPQGESVAFITPPRPRCRRPADAFAKGLVSAWFGRMHKLDYDDRAASGKEAQATATACFPLAAMNKDMFVTMMRGRRMMASRSWARPRYGLRVNNGNQITQTSRYVFCVNL